MAPRAGRRGRPARDHQRPGGRGHPLTALVYGANGYTGRLISELAAARGLKPILAGRSADKVRPLAERLGLQWRAFDVAHADLSGVTAVLHCAGPFSATSAPMLDACLRAKAHYLDITGEIDVLEAVLQADARCKEAGIVAVPGVGMDVVPTDCLAALLAEKLPGATRLTLALATRGGLSRGTALSALEGVPRGNRARRAGRIVTVPFSTRNVPFADRARRCLSIAWGDVATAYHSTGIPDVDVFAALPAPDLAKLTAPLLKLGAVQRFLHARAERIEGPSAEVRARGGVEVWGRVERDGAAVEGTLTTKEGYTFTADSALACLAGVHDVKPGAWTPSKAFGSRFVLSLPNVRSRIE